MLKIEGELNREEESEKEDVPRRGNDAKQINQFKCTTNLIEKAPQNQWFHLNLHIKLKKGSGKWVYESNPWNCIIQNVEVSVKMILTLIAQQWLDVVFCSI